MIANTIGFVSICVSLAISHTPVYIAKRDHGCEASASRGVPVYVSATSPVGVFIAPTLGGMARLS